MLHENGNLEISIVSSSIKRTWLKSLTQKSSSLRKFRKKVNDLSFVTKFSNSPLWS